MIVIVVDGADGLKNINVICAFMHGVKIKANIRSIKENIEMENGFRFLK